MADRYWVGGNDNWNATAGSKWATTSGGAGGASVPSSTDRAIFDANSGNAIVTLTSSATVGSVIMTGFTGTFAGNANLILDNNAGAGELTVPNTVTWEHTGDIDFRDSSTITVNFNVTHQGNVDCEDITTLSVADNFTITGAWTQQQGTISIAAGKTITASTYATSGASAKVIAFAAGSEFRLTGTTSAVISFSSSLTFTGDAKFNCSGTGTFMLALAGRTLHTLTLSGSTPTITITGANTFTNFIDACTAAHTLKFEASISQTVTTFTVECVGFLASIESTIAATQWTLSCASAVIRGASLKDSVITGTGIATWSTNRGNNSGWRFSRPGVFIP